MTLVLVRHFPSRSDEEAVCSFVIRTLGKFGFDESLFEVAVEFLAPGVHLGPGDFAAFDGEQAVAVGFDADGDGAGAQGGCAGQEQAQEVHGVFPADFAVVADVLANLLELAQGVAVEGLEDHLRQKNVANGQQFFAQWSQLFHERGVKAFEDVGIGFEGHDEEFLEFPMAALRGVVLELLGRAEQGPLEVGGREINAAVVGVGVVGIQAVRAGADGAAVDDEGFEVKVGGGRAIAEAIFEMFEDVELVAGERGGEAVGKTDEKMLFGAGRGAGDDADRAARMDKGIVGTADFNQRDNLGAGGDVIG